MSIKLTEREIRVLILLSHGWTNRQIAKQMGTTEGAVSTHTWRMCTKLQAKGRAHALAIAFRAGVIS